MYILEIIFGSALLIASGHWLINSTGRLAIALRIPTLLISLVLIAYGSSSPEIAVSLSAALRDANEIVIGNVVGSNIINIALILGLGALIMPLKAHYSLLRREAPLMLLVTLLIPVALWDFKLSRIEGIVALSLGVAYTALLIFSALRERKSSRSHPEKIVGSAKGGKWGKHLLIALFALAGMIFGADLFVKGAIILTEKLGASPLLIGLTVVAIGTSLPELVTTIIAVIKKEEDIAISNIIGSNIFNGLIVLGLTATVSPITLDASNQALWVDMGVMCLITMIFVGLISLGSHKVTRLSGAFLLTSYAAYMIYLFWFA